MACPYFWPIDKVDGTWPHPHRLPLGGGWSGQCMAPGHEGELPSDAELRDSCNLGYATACARLPQDRAWDSVRFGAKALAANGSLVQVKYVCERDHRPVEHGVVIFDALDARWESSHPDERVQRLAECFLQSHLEKKKRELEPADSVDVPGKNL